MAFRSGFMLIGRPNVEITLLNLLTGERWLSCQPRTRHTIRQW